MDVFGRENEAAYFRASVWSWRPLHLLIQEANTRFELGIGPECLDDMACNSGAGLKTQAECNNLADALEKLLPEYPSEVIHFDTEPQGIEGEVLHKLKAAGWQTDSAGYRIKKEHVKEFIGFLRECGGFCVW